MTPQGPTPPPERLRAFFAIDLPDATRRAAAAVADGLRGAPDGDAVRWVRPDSLHVTLRFLGSVESPRVPGLTARVREAVAGAAPFELSLGGLQTFPPRRPRIVALGVAPEAPVAALAAAVERAVVAEGFAPERRPFRPHLTLGRVRGRRCPDVGAAAAPPPTPFAVTEAVLFGSDTRPDGARYTPLEHLALGGAPVHPE